MDEVVRILELTWESVFAALTLRPSAVPATTTADAVWVSLIVAVAVAASALFGQSVLLHLNRVRRLAFWLTTAMSAVVVVVTYLLSAGVFLLCGTLLGESPRPDRLVLATLLATSPQLFGFLVVIPGFGQFIGRLLTLWCFLILWVIAQTTFDISRWGALVVALAGWGVPVLVLQTVGRPFAALRDQWWVMLTGRRLRRSSSELLAIAGIDDADLIFDRHRRRGSRAVRR